MRICLFALVVLVCALGCGTDEGATGPAPSEDPQSATFSPATANAAERGGPEKPRKRPRGRPLPALSGQSLEGKKISVADLLGKRLILYIFNPDVRQAAPVTQAVNAIAPLQGKQNFEILGIATGSNRAQARAYVADQGIEFPVIDDSSAQLAQTLGLREPVTLLATDSEGFLTYGVDGFADLNAAAIEESLRTVLRLPDTGPAGPQHPLAPDFSGDILGSDERFELSAQGGKGVILIFFLHTCPHCHHALESLRSILEGLPEQGRPTLVGVELTGRTHAVRSLLKQEGLDYFPVLFDDDGSIQRDYRVFGGVPDIFFIDASGHIIGRLQSWEEQTHQPLARMRAAKIGGGPVPMLLNTRGYSGNEVCGICHETEYDTWQFTTHASAYDTLVTHGADTDEECVSCHVLGHGQPGGFLDSIATPQLEDVGCESCHGRGGPHLSPGFVPNGDYGAVCITCHDTEHSLGFDYEKFRPRISHAENAHLLELAPEEQQRLLAERGRPGGSPLPTAAEFVGSDACRTCHAAEFETWAGQPHAHAVASLKTAGKASDTDCLRCHTTGFGLPGGYSVETPLPDQTDLARVGCESCHGPGGDHVEDSAPKVGTILSLGDKCDSCVILQICGSCHDDANDSGFEFEVQEKIDRQRHGTKEPGGKPKTAASKQRAVAIAERG
ncbi:MAG: multiheme c-type cytochrome [Myxococcota bacterium]|nr:redoxin domain-containing protein [bacterium]MDP6073853.1 multiheme c-type cytochrome [Myxococcota bacterium]MDP6244530.1 multiheme c-type cytochrome [Myxococcota bacterium]MDP7073618.1 multiheme c-type cytochrome [Myxococcota bacterium]MDP7298148.1 multiheme c-type cytochrome [Myxococcota bacterium]